MSDSNADAAPADVTAELIPEYCDAGTKNIVTYYYDERQAELQAKQLQENPAKKNDATKFAQRLNDNNTGLLPPDAARYRIDNETAMSEIGGYDNLGTKINACWDASNEKYTKAQLKGGGKGQKKKRKSPFKKRRSRKRRKSKRKRKRRKTKRKRRKTKRKRRKSRKRR